MASPQLNRNGIPVLGTVESRNRQACRRKRPYPTLQAAQAGADALHARDGGDMYAYGCPVCGRFHVGHRAPVVIQ